MTLLKKIQMEKNHI